MSIKQHKDQLGREVVITSSPKRIVSLVPSQTELLHYLGLKDEVIGITKFCIHPEEWFKSKRRVGGTKKVNHSAIDELKPGFQNAIEDKDSRYPEITPEDIQELNPDFVFLSSEPFPFSAKHIKSYQYWTKKDNIMLVDGELFSWYGSRMLLAPTYFQELIERTK